MIASMSIREISKPVEEHLEAFHTFFRGQMRSRVPLLDLVIRYVLRQRGKRVRPALVFLSAQLCGGINSRTYTGAAMVELLHTATLVHDDVVDEANERRGMASVNAIWKNKAAVLVGDYLLSRGLLIAVENEEFGFLKATSHAVRRMSEGELLQMQKSRQLNIDEETYFRIIGDKTASLLASCCQIGAGSATADTAIIERLREYGELVGTAFQIRDDLLDYVSRTNLIGKPMANDLKERKITLPLIYACRQAGRKEGREIISLLKKGKLDQQSIQHIMDFVRSYGGVDYAQNKAAELSKQAADLLRDFPDSAAKNSLLDFAEFVISRKS
jgi:octaprenyl-diphosphate synthase